MKLLFWAIHHLFYFSVPSVEFLTFENDIFSEISQRRKEHFK